jgi:hypothetical protein
MNALRKALADYFVVRRALGFKLYRAEKLLGQFLTFVENRGEDHLTTETALAWATLPQRGRTWAYARLSVVRRFANHLRGIDPATEVPPTHLLVQQKGRATPYLYSESDIAALIAASGMLRTPHRVATFRTLIALLAVTGMRVGEAIGLQPVFRQIVDCAGLKPRSASCRPRLHDLRHGFAVNTILDGYRDGGGRGTGSRCCRPTLATSILSVRIGISRLRLSC